MGNSSLKDKKLLSDKRVVAEIERHLWIESERVGYDIGYEQAKVDWLDRFSRDWMSYHMPELAAETKKVAKATRAPIAKKKAKTAGGAKKRRAKSYLK